MNPDLLLAHYDRISEAPEAISRLRRFILDLAVRGKLVERDPKDEPASVLLQRIRACRARLVSEGAVKKQIVLPEVTLADCPFPLPAGWVWTRLGEVIQLLSGQHLQPGEYSETDTGRIPYVTGPADFGGNGLVITRYALVNKAIAKSGQILLTVKGAGVGKTAICDLPQVAISRQLMAMTAIEWNQKFLLLTTHRLAVSLLESARSLIPGISRDDVERFVFPLPPLNEQARIVSKVDELVALCGRLEESRREQERQRALVSSAALHDLSNGDTDDDRRRRAQFYVDHLNEFTAMPSQIPNLRRAVLSLAVRGRLSPQNPNDESSSDLLKRIRVEKIKLVEAGNLKRDKKTWEGLPKRPPFEIPPSWSWAQLQDVFEISRGGSPRPAGDPRYFGGPIPWITVGEITKDSEKYLTETDGGLTAEGANRSRFINPGDLLLTNSGATLGVPKISKIRACMNDGVALLRQFHSEPLNDFAYIYLHSQTDAFRQVNQGMGQPNLNTPIIAGWFFPLPPLAEQCRIVAKVDELMVLCDELEENLADTRIKRSRLLESILYHAMNDRRGVKATALVEDVARMPAVNTT